jgi:hypothetical protein
LSVVTVYDDNTVGRLHKLLSAYKQNASQNHKIGVTWAATLGMAELPTPDLFARLRHVYGLPAQVDAELDRLDSSAEYDADMATRWREPVAAAFAMSLFAEHLSASMSGYFDVRALDSLESCSYVLHRYRPQPAVSDIELERITQLVSDLQEEIASDEGLDPELRSFLLYHAHLMARALRDVDISGNGALEEAYDQAIGAIIRRWDLVVQAKEDEKKKSFWEKWFAVITAVAAALQIATSALMLPGQIRQELEGPAPQPPAVVKVIERPGPHQPYAGGTSKRPLGHH